MVHSAEVGFPQYFQTPITHPGGVFYFIMGIPTAIITFTYMESSAFVIAEL